MSDLAETLPRDWVETRLASANEVLAVHPRTVQVLATEIRERLGIRALPAGDLSAVAQALLETIEESGR